MVSGANFRDWERILHIFSILHDIGGKQKKILLFSINDKRKITMDSLSMDAFRLSKETRDTKFQNRLEEIFKDKSFAKWSWTMNYV